MKRYTTLLLTLLCLPAVPAIAQTAIGGGSCTSGTLNGTYELILNGRQVTAAGAVSKVFQGVGTAAFDGLVVGHGAATGTTVGPLIEERLWPNEKYRWLSGILQHTTNRVAPPSELAYFVGYNPNPNAAVPAPDTVRRAFTGEAEFHTMWQRPRRPQ